MVTEKSAYYMLRKTLPLWRAQKTIDEILGFARLNRVDEIIWKIDVEEFSHGLPPLKMVREYLPYLNKAREALDRHGIKSSVNPWVTMSHADRGRNAGCYHSKMRMFVNAKGKSHTNRACPMDDVWQDWLVAAYKLYASTKPEILWLEDDLTHIPKECQGEEVLEYGCFCQAHLAEISRISGQRWSRETLLEALKWPGKPLSVRKMWFDLHGSAMLRLAGKLEPAVHSVSKNTRLGLMCSHSIDGRWWDKFVRKISGNLQPVVRPSLSIYQEQRPTIHLFDITDHRKECRCVPEESQICPELENWPYTVFAKSTRFTRLEFGISQLMGYPGITINIFDHLGTPAKESKRYYQLLKEIKPKLSGVALKAGGNGKEKGVGIIFRKEAADFTHLKKGQTTMDLRASADGDAWARVLQGCGIAVKWDEETTVLAVSGQVLRACTISEIKNFLSNGLLLDASAAEVLCQLGFADYIGCKFNGWVNRHDLVIVAEEFPGSLSKKPGYQKFSSLENHSLNNLAKFSLSEKTKVVSWLVNNDRERKVPSMVLFKNSLGGRIAVYPIDLSAGIGDGYVDWHRKEHLHSAVNWLGRGRTDLFVEGGAWMIPLRRDFPNYIFIGLVNLETDSWKEITLTISTERKIKKVKRVQENGAWKTCRAVITRSDDSNVRIEINEALDYMDFTAFVIE